jgi:hypothetical protein
MSDIQKIHDDAVTMLNLITRNLALVETLIPNGMYISASIVIAAVSFLLASGDEERMPVLRDNVRAFVKPAIAEYREFCDMDLSFLDKTDD